MAVKRPSTPQVKAVALSLGIHLDDAKAEAYRQLLQPNFDAYDAVDEMPDFVPAVKYARGKSYRPGADENRYGAWYVKTTITGASGGKLAGKTVVIKDNVCVAGVPMMNGSPTMEGFVPTLDATIITRLLDAGATVVGKSVCEMFCFSGGSHTRPPVRSTTRTAMAIRPAVRRRAARPSSLPVKSTSRSAATRAARSACRLRIAASTA